MVKLTKAEELAFLSMAGRIKRVINASDADKLCCRGLAVNLGSDGYILSEAGQRRLQRQYGRQDMKSPLTP